MTDKKPIIAKRPFQISDWGVNPQSQALRSLSEEEVRFVLADIVNTPIFVSDLLGDVKSLLFLGFQQTKILLYLPILFQNSFVYHVLNYHVLVLQNR